MTADRKRIGVRTLAAAALAVTLVLSAGATSVALAAGATEVTIAPADQTVGVGDSTTFDVVVDTTSGGVGAASGTVALTDPSVAEITAIDLAGDPAFPESSIADDGSSASFLFASGGNTLADDPAGVTVATVTVAGTAAGETDLTLGEAPFELGDADGSDYTVTGTTDATLTVTPQNQPPVADAGADQTVEEGETVELDGSASSDPDGDALTYAWAQVGDGPDVSLDDASAAQPTFTAPEVESATTLDFEVTVDDGAASDTDTVSVTVEPLSPATFAVSNLDAPASAEQGESITVSADVTNDGEQAGTKTVEFQLDGTSVASQQVTLAPGETETVSFDVTVPADLAPGTYTHGVFTADDGATAQLDVEAAPDAPDLTSAVSLSPAEQTVGVGGSVTYDVVVENADGGVGAVDLVVSVDDASVATIDAIEPAVSTVDDEATVAEDGSSASLSAFGMDTADEGAVTVATVTVDAAAVDTTQLSLDVTALGTEDGEDVTVTDTAGATLVVEPASFLVSDLDAPADVVRGETVSVSASVTNDGSIETSKTVEFRFDLNGDGTLAANEAVASKTVTLAPGETETVPFVATVPADLALGTYAHGVFTVDDDATGEIAVTLPVLDESYAGPPGDLDGDGLYEDVNGNGEFNLVDVQAAFANRDDPTLTENDALFDFTGNGVFDLVDIQRLFAEVNE
ncbi:PKD domain-containing protein [Halomarina ordinaria]|uniref:CARDB domain-containing protein n=1 Tax=Halomarina ordinaria TaxID=3033939 RepID=A0ABD5U7C3_9EURY|nr:CARDB domain-containing protein [Halomarina sp. PSRA2]